ncbi:TIR domain-containing protein [Erwinia mallotivora]|uniref:Thoeris protein ThsB TIR-like domain-containing protein n=1 Tax=Erwinia mallotivora TaxID=69222 RepID=A0A014Q132_9GAMM|nr:TIR domain-containing protein [Erwinia mallotivora]EXU76887.1 hypothetical protein BG55_03100 [Erwinia mallotivora]
MKKSYHVFISHCWDYNDALNNLKDKLNKEADLIASYEEVTVDKPVNSEDATYIKRVLREKIKSSDVFIVVAGMYTCHSEWMQWEIETAVKNQIPVIGIRPHGSLRIPKVVTDNAKIIVGWYTPSIITAIQEC